MLSDYNNNQKQKIMAKKGTFKSVWEKNDTILTLFCIKFPNKLKQLGFHDTTSQSARGGLANHIIGSSEYSLNRQIGNIEFLMGKNETQDCVSGEQRRVFDEYNHMSEDELYAICEKIVENTPSSVYKKFLVIQEKNWGIDKEISEKKTRETFKSESDSRRDAELRRLGFDPSKMKSKGTK